MNDQTSNTKEAKLNLEISTESNPMAIWSKEKNRLLILKEVGLTVTQLLDLEQIYDFTEDTMVRRLGVEKFLLYLWNEEESIFRLGHSYGIEEEIIRRIENSRNAGLDFVQEIADTRKPLFIPRLDEDNRVDEKIREMNKNHYYFGFPLISRKTVVGVIELISQSLPEYDQDNVFFLENLGRLIGIALDNAILVAKANKQQNDAMTLYQLGIKISSSLVLSEILDAVAESAKILTNSDLGLIGLFQENCHDIKIWSTNGEGGKQLEGLVIKTDQNNQAKKLLNGEAVTGSLDIDDEQHLHPNKILQLEGVVSYLAVPILIGNRFFGIIEVMNRSHHNYAMNEIQLLRQLGYHVFVAVENARLHQQLRYAAALEEQNRLARELHDNLAQAMGYIKIKAIMVNEMLSKSEYEKSQIHLHELIKTTGVLYTDIRETIFNLRNTDYGKENFLVGLQNYLDEYQKFYDLEVRFSADDNTSMEFPPEVGNQLLRIIQEALSNVRKHACAQRVWIQCRQEQGEILVRIEDDGSGFNPDEYSIRKNATQNYGMQIMQERVQYINGRLVIKSEPGKGTIVSVYIPSIYKPG